MNAAFFLMAASTVVAAPTLDVVLVMDNSGSMDEVAVVDGIPRYCPEPEQESGDPGCLSGDPEHLRGPLLQSLIDSLTEFGGCGVAVVRFSEWAEASNDSLVLLDAATRDSQKAAIFMEAIGQTNYTAALRTAFRVLKGSTKPRSHQAIVFLTDGRPNLPRPGDGGPYLYKDFQDSLPSVHGIFMEGNSDNGDILRELAARTGGSFHSFRAGRSMDSLMSRGILSRLRDVGAVSLPKARRISRSHPSASKTTFRPVWDPLGRWIRPFLRGPALP